MASTIANTLKTPLWNTQNDLPQEVRLGALGLLNQQLADTAHLFTEVSRGVDKLPWKVEAHAQARD